MYMYPIVTQYLGSPKLTNTAQLRKPLTVGGENALKHLTSHISPHAPYRKKVPYRETSDLIINTGSSILRTQHPTVGRAGV
jgi:hypothetical protein